jgi:hypothetical protein
VEDRPVSSPELEIIEDTEVNIVNNISSRVQHFTAHDSQAHSNIPFNTTRERHNSSTISNGLHRPPLGSEIMSG